MSEPNYAGARCPVGSPLYPIADLYALCDHGETWSAWTLQRPSSGRRPHLTFHSPAKAELSGWELVVGVPLSEALAAIAQDIEARRGDADPARLMPV